MTLFTLALGLALAAPAAAEPRKAGPPDDPAWTAVEDARSSTGFAQALDAFLLAHPHGPSAARALREQAGGLDDLGAAEALLHRATREGAGSAPGSAAALDLARLKYAEDRPEAALSALEAADAWPRPEALQPEWLYWRGQCRLALKGWQRAADDFRQLAAAWPRHARAEAALLGEADCEGSLGHDDTAAAVYGRVVAGNGSFTAQALWGLGTVRLRQLRIAEARDCFRRLQAGWPSSFEGHAAADKLAQIAALPKSAAQPAPKPRLRGLWDIQVAAYSRLDSAKKRADLLHSHGFKVRVRLRRLDGRPLYLVKVGPYASRAKAEAAAAVLQGRENLPCYIVEE